MWAGTTQRFILANSWFFVCVNKLTGNWQLYCPENAASGSPLLISMAEAYGDTPPTHLLLNYLHLTPCYAWLSKMHNILYLNPATESHRTYVCPHYTSAPWTVFSKQTFILQAPSMNVWLHYPGDTTHQIRPGPY